MVCETRQLRLVCIGATCLNPCFNGIWSARQQKVTTHYGSGVVSLNPCFNGIWSARRPEGRDGMRWAVLILVLMEYGLRALQGRLHRHGRQGVLILVLMEYGLRGCATVILICCTTLS